MTLRIDDLRNSGDFLNILFDTITSAIFLVDDEVRITEFNDSFSQLFSGQELDLLLQLPGTGLQVEG